MQTITDSVSSSVPSASPTIDDCPSAEILTNSSSSEEKLLSVLENANEEEKVPELANEKTADETAKISDEEQRQDIEDSTAAKQSAEVVTGQKGETVENDTTEDPDADIEWLTPFSNPSTEETEEDNNSKEGKDAGEQKTGIVKTLKKGAVAAVGGSMVGLGLVMIPLPTPFGAVVASSGLAVLGTEFDEAKELNDKLVGGAKRHLNKARDKVVKGIEKMNKDDDDADGSSSSVNNQSVNSSDKVAETESGEAGNVIKVNAADALANDGGNIETSSSDDSENSGSGTESPPVWLHMNPIERERQEKLAKHKYKRDRQTTYEQVKEGMTKRTGKFLSKTLLPLIKKSEKDKKVASETDIEPTVNELQIDGTKEDAVTVDETNEKDEEGKVVVSI